MQSLHNLMENVWVAVKFYETHVSPTSVLDHQMVYCSIQIFVVPDQVELFLYLIFFGSNSRLKSYLAPNLFVLVMTLSNS